MSRLRIFEEEHPDQPVVVARTLAEIARELAADRRALRTMGSGATGRRPAIRPRW